MLNSVRCECHEVSGITHDGSGLLEMAEGRCHRSLDITETIQFHENLLYNLSHNIILHYTVQ